MKDAKAHCAPMLKWRTKVVGHSDWKTILKRGADPLPGIKPDEVEKGIQMLGELVNEIDWHFNGRKTAFEHLPLDGTGDDLMNCLKIALEAWLREVKEKHGVDVKAIREGRAGVNA